MSPEELKSKIESILFVSSKPLTVKDFVKQLEQQAFSIQSALDQLVEERKNSGIVVLDNNGSYQLATSPTNSTVVKDFLNADLREKLTDATVEVLAIIAYRQPISKAEIEAIRGVNSQYSIRHLLMRGLIEKVSNPHDARSFLYQTTTEFLQHLGLISVKELPEFTKLVENIKLPETPALAENTPEAVDNSQITSQTIPEPENSPMPTDAKNEIIIKEPQPPSINQTDTEEDSNNEEFDDEDDEDDEE